MKKKGTKREREKQNSYNKKLLILVIGVFVICAIALNFINVTKTNVTKTNITVTGHATTEGFIDKLFTDWSSGNLDVNIAKYLFWIMLTLFIFSVLNGTGIPDNTLLQWLVAIPIGFLSTAYITPEEVFGILTGWTALGITLSTLAPFIIMMLSSAFILAPYEKKTGNVRKVTIGQVILVQTLWIGFLFFLFYKVISGWSSGLFGAGISFGVLIVGGVFFASMIIVVFSKSYRNWIRKIGYELRSTEAEAVKVASKVERSIVGED